MSAILVSLIVPALLLIAYVSFLRPWQLRWGATEEELSRVMPGDDIVSRPSFNATRAVTVCAGPERIWPWILQIGVTRAGWYSYDLLDNLGRKSAETILPQFQSVQAGDLIPMSPDGKAGLWVKDFQVYEWMLWWDGKADVSWLWAIYPVGEGLSRLVTRVRVKYRWCSSAIVFNLIIEFFDILMMRKCMLGIKRRAETLPKQ